MSSSNLIRKDMKRSEWRRILQRRFASTTVNSTEFKGEISLIEIQSVTKPLTVSCGGRNIKIVDDGYFWLQIAPEGRFHWITAMFNNDGDLIEMYFDMTDQNHINQDDSWFYDLFLDVVILPTGEKYLLDQDELDEAFNQQVINEHQYNKAVNEANQILAMDDISLSKLMILMNDKMLELKELLA